MPVQAKPASFRIATLGLAGRFAVRVKWAKTFFAETFVPEHFAGRQRSTGTVCFSVVHRGEDADGVFFLA